MVSARPKLNARIPMAFMISVQQLANHYGDLWRILCGCSLHGEICTHVMWPNITFMSINPYLATTDNEWSKAIAVLAGRHSSVTLNTSEVCAIFVTNRCGHFLH